MGRAAAAITIASELVLYCCYVRVLMRTVGTPPLLKMAWRPVLASLLLGLALVALRGWPLLAFLLAAPLYAGLLLALRTVTAEDRAVLGRGLRALRHFFTRHLMANVGAISEVGRDGSNHERTCVAVSKDGINWTKPELGLFAVPGSAGQIPDS